MAYAEVQLLSQLMKMIITIIMIIIIVPRWKRAGYRNLDGEGATLEVCEVHT